MLCASTLQRGKGLGHTRFSEVTWVGVIQHSAANTNLHLPLARAFAVAAVAFRQAVQVHVGPRFAAELDDLVGSGLG
jgi:hypothetical protein